MAEEIKNDAPVQSKTPLAASLLANDSAPKGAASKVARPKASAAPKKGKHKHTHIEHHDNGSHTVRHSGDAGETSYSAQDLDAVHDGLEQHVGDPNGDEGQEQMAGGAPAGGAAPQPGTAPAGAQPQVA